MPFQSEKQRRYLHANHPEIAKRWERDYGAGGIAALNAQLNQLPEYYLPAAHGGRIGFNEGTYRDRLQKDYESLTKGADWMRTAPPKWWLFPEKYGKNRDDAMTFFKERFMYGDLDPIPTPLEAIKKSPELVKFMKWLDERREHATGGIANHFKKRVKLQDSVESLSDTEFQTMYPEWDPNQFTREEYLQLLSENEGNGVLDLRTDDEAIEVASTEENEIIPDLLAPGSAAGILRLKDGGTPQLAQKSKSGKRPGYGGPHKTEAAGKASTASSGGSDRGPRDDPDRFGPTTETKTTTTGDGYQDRIIELQDRQRKEDLKDIIARGDEEKYDDPRDKYSFTKAGVDKRKTLTTQQYNTRKEELEKKIRNSFFKIFGLSFLGVVPTPASFVGIDWENKKLSGVLGDAMDLDKLTKDYLAELESFKQNYKDLGIPEFHHAVDTPIQTINQEILDITQKPDKEDPGRDGPPLTIDVLAETKEEVEEAPNMISMMDRIRANQAKRAMLVDKDIIQESPIVDESVTDIVMKANKGGLANLFRVKNQ